jgi:hypothetical protein
MNFEMFPRDNTSPYNGEWEHDRDWHQSPESPNISHHTLTMVLRDSVRCGWRKQFASFVPPHSVSGVVHTTQPKEMVGFYY